MVTAYDGVEALEKVANEKPDLITLDIMMPRKDGFEVMRDLQADPATANIPIVILSQKAQDADIFRGWQSGCVSYLTKPFNPSELLAQVESIFQSLDEGPGSTGGVWEA
ncbi:MAG: response regulator [Candidatus Subteraquimicrobiales bacterium]|nr:response regulator [Candidatus Subteraquimicrobiales bacterium]